MPGWKQLPGAEVLSPRPRPGNLSQRFRECGSGAISLLRELLKLDWRARINAHDALQHPYFRNAPLPARPEDLPRFEESHEFDRRKFQDRKVALPPAPKGGTVGRGAMDNLSGPNSGFNTGEGFHGRNGANGSRYPRNGPPGPLPGERRPAWQRDRDRDLPPRPPLPHDYPNGRDGGLDHPDGYRGRGRDGPPRGRGGGVGGPREPPVDTYIPSYDRDGGAGRREPPRDDRRRHDWDDRHYDWDRRRIDYDDRSRHSRTRSRSRSPIIRDRDRDRDYRR